MPIDRPPRNRRRSCGLDGSKVALPTLGGTFESGPDRYGPDGGMFAVPEALADKVIHPFGDFLLHDIGTGDGIVQIGPQDTANKLRTAPLWGLRTKPRSMHDLRSLSLENAISRHAGEAH